MEQQENNQKRQILQKNWSAESSQILNTSYNIEDKTMTVLFRSGKYKYLDVPLEVWNKSLKAASIGKFINQEIKPNYGFEKLPS